MGGLRLANAVPDSRVLTGLLPAGQRPDVSLSAQAPTLLPVCLQESEDPRQGSPGLWANGRGLLLAPVASGGLRVDERGPGACTRGCLSRLGTGSLLPELAPVGQEATLCPPCSVGEGLGLASAS